MESLLTSSPYANRLGVAIDSMTTDALRLSLPFKDENSNPGKALHGGVAASMINFGGQTLGGHVLGADAAPFHTAAVQVSYLAAAINEPIIADAVLLRRGKEICFLSVDVHTNDNKPIARGLCTVRGRFGAEPSPSVAAAGDDGAADPGPMGPFVPKNVAFIGRLGLNIEHMAGGRSRIRMPFLDINANADGGVHEGAILAHLDTAGAMAAWAETGPGPFKASTVGIQAQIVAAAPAEDLVAFGRLAQRDREIFWSEVEVALASTKSTVARGTVLYRIVTS